MLQCSWDAFCPWQNLVSKALRHPIRTNASFGSKPQVMIAMEKHPQVSWPSIIQYIPSQKTVHLNTANLVTVFVLNALHVKSIPLYSFFLFGQIPVLLFSFSILFLYSLGYFIPSEMSLHIWHGICLSYMYLLILQVCPCNVLCLCQYISMKHMRINNYKVYYFCFPLLIFSSSV